MMLHKHRHSYLFYIGFIAFPITSVHFVLL